MRLDHLLSKEKEEVRVVMLLSFQGKAKEFAGGDALMGNTRTHPEHDG